ncbi:TPR repeat-containing thioredoxin TDX [Capsicum baccatum]|uniref:TPR repeat-containing thioredoxin TDX n=1 Tax=Capsicum baccatum TaxID=33114 RepID=A0A2G2W324_CAPBA|nr:TPR repeat-containing thioredoxin TDX [Capsicum baccatum]
MTQSGHFWTKSVCHSPRFWGWAPGPGVLWAKSRPRLAREVGDRPSVDHLILWGYLGEQMGETARTGHYQAKSVSYSPRFWGWARGMGVLWTKNRSERAKEVVDHPSMILLIFHGHWVDKRAKQRGRGIFGQNQCAIIHDFGGGPGVRAYCRSIIVQDVPVRLGIISKSRVVDESDDEMSDVEDKEDEKGAFEEEEKPEIIESDIELDESDIVDPDNDEPQQMRDPSVEVTEESRDASQAAKSQAMEAISEVDCKLEEASELLTKAVLLNPISAIICVLTATVCIKMKKPNAAIQDANAALEINPDLAKGYKSRGVARAMLGLWGDAARDLHVASKLDFDEEISAVLKKVEPNARKIEEHHKKYDRLRKEREDRKVERERQWRKAEAQVKLQLLVFLNMINFSEHFYDLYLRPLMTRPRRKKKNHQGELVAGMPGGFPEGLFGGAPGGMARGGSSGSMPQGGAPGGTPGGMPGNIDYSKILNKSCCTFCIFTSDSCTIIYNE